MLPPELAAYMGTFGELVFPVLLVLGLMGRFGAAGLFMVNVMAVVSYPQLFGFECPACDHRWSTVFDIASYLWSEIHAWAKRLLRTVDTLARTYAWREADILALSPSRRQIYLELARQ